MHECGLSEIHRPVRISRHQVLDIREFRFWNGCEFQRAGADEFPRGFDFMAMVAYELKEFGEDGLGC